VRTISSAPAALASTMLAATKRSFRATSRSSRAIAMNHSAGSRYAKPERQKIETPCGTGAPAHPS
jgi:hypothetical protein